MEETEVEKSVNAESANTEESQRNVEVDAMDVEKPVNVESANTEESQRHVEIDKVESSAMDIEPHPDEDDKAETSATRDPITIEESQSHVGGNEESRSNVGGNEVEQNPPMGEPTSIEGDASLEPFEGMKFDTRNAAHSFYVEYATHMGFRASTKFTSRSRRNGMFISVVYVCSKNGFRKHKGKDTDPQSISKEGCKAALKLKRIEGGKWIVREFIKEHNHELGPDPEVEDKNEPDPDPDVDIRDTFFMRKDYLDHLDKIQRKPLVFAVEDVEAISEHFIRMQLLHPTFFYGIEVDEEQYLRNIFWADAKSRLDYTHFGDVIFFDTVYLTNKYHMPLATFVGVNHHGQSLLFGCALITDETTSSFVWVFKTWLRAMYGKPPKAIITNHDNAIKSAIAEVFPKICHCFCLSHILKKVPEELADVCRAHDNFMKKFEKCIYDSVTTDEFERRWEKLIAKFSLVENEWLRSLHEDRRQWVPAYLKDSFLAGLPISQRNETINSIFDTYVTKKTTLKEFIEQYEIALQNRCEKEAQAEFETLYKKRSLRTPSPFEAQLAPVYTKDMFKKFQIEVLGIVACHTTNIQQDGATTKYTVKDLETKKDYTVMWNGYEAKVSCICHLFEFRGFLCRHVMTVFVASGLYKIPPHYILKRWTKDAKCTHVLDEGFVGLQGDCHKSIVQRSHGLYQQVIRFAEEGSLSKEGYNVALCALQEALEKVVLANDSLGRLAHQTTSSNYNRSQDKETQMQLLQQGGAQCHYMQGESTDFRQPMQHVMGFATNGTNRHGSMGSFQWQMREPYQ
ncbi:protein FAR-RED IMPAIRED RESPONSE 1-like isoform X2 [Tasmannia lanceolata]|uniref:protein FAR-RED IMPAIRED RESPONSE 1-like isoform X2 n=1 Tax=Tasmannia lanceolata TaxID=3420 RepID=UPI00406395A1